MGVLILLLCPINHIYVLMPSPPPREMLAELEESLRTAAVLPVRLSVADVFDGICTELVCTAYIDVGGRGRPRVTYDVTAALADLGLKVFQADIFWVTDAQLANDSGGMWCTCDCVCVCALFSTQTPPPEHIGSLASGGFPGPRQLLEVHRFLVHYEGSLVHHDIHKQLLYDGVRAYLIGS